MRPPRASRAGRLGVLGVRRLLGQDTSVRAPAALAGAAALLALALGGCGSSTPEGPPSPSSPPTAACPDGTPVAGQPALTTQLVARGLSDPLDLQAAPGDRTRVFVAEQGGRIRIIRDGALQGAIFLDIASRISA